MMRTYNELRALRTFEERFSYLQLKGDVGKDTFGFDRYLNRIFYNSQEWQRVRREVIIRDQACDLGVEGYEIDGHILVHHMNPISVDDIVNRTDLLLNPNYLICVSHATHNALHYGSLIAELPSFERLPNDTVPWR